MITNSRKIPMSKRLDNIDQNCTFLKKRCQNFFSKVEEGTVHPSIIIIDKFKALCQQTIELIRKDKMQEAYQNNVDQKRLSDMEHDLQVNINRLQDMENSLPPEDRINILKLIDPAVIIPNSREIPMSSAVMIPNSRKIPMSKRLDNIDQSCTFLKKRCQNFFSKVEDGSVLPSIIIIDKFKTLCQQKIEYIRKDKMQEAYQNNVDQRRLSDIEHDLQVNINRLQDMENSLPPEDRINVLKMIDMQYPDVLREYH